jgi:putative transposase
MGRVSNLITPHELYLQLGETVADRELAYQAFFGSDVSEKSLGEIREATNKGWVLGSPRFAQQIENMLARPVCRRERGGDRRSARYHKVRAINRN